MWKFGKSVTSIIRSCLVGDMKVRIYIDEFTLRDLLLVLWFLPRGLFSLVKEELYWWFILNKYETNTPEDCGWGKYGRSKWLKMGKEKPLFAKDSTKKVMPSEAELAIIP